MTRIIYLSLITAFIINFTSCKKKEIQSSNNTTIEITLENELGEKISGQYIKMFDEETFSIFKKDSNTKALYESLTNADGKAIFIRKNKIISFRSVRFFGFFLVKTSCRQDHDFIDKVFRHIDLSFHSG